MTLIWAVIVAASVTATQPNARPGLRDPGPAAIQYHLTKPMSMEHENISGDSMVGTAGLELNRLLKVKVSDAWGKTVANVPVFFRVLSEPRENRPGSGSASIADSMPMTGPDGIAATGFRFGATPGEYRVEVEAGGTALVYSLLARTRDWILAMVFGLLGGLSFFLFGLYYGSKGLRRLAGHRLREWMFALTRNRVLGLVAGIVVTVMFQSSSATTALLVSFATTGLLTLGQSLGVILGADIGTTLTVQLLAFRVFDYAVTLTAVGFIVMYFWRRFRDIGQAVFGFGLVFFSLKIVSDAFAPLKLDPEFPKVLAALGSAPVWGTLVSIIFTFLVRSSAATVGIAVGLAMSGVLSLQASVPIILGANVGTALNAWVASWRGNTEAKRIALGHVLFKIIIVVPLLFLIRPLADLVAQTSGSVPRQIANAHTLINVAAALLFLPFLGGYERLIRSLLREGKDESKKQPRYLEPSLLATPSVAVGQAAKEVQRMADVVMEMLQASLPVFLKNDKDGRHEIIAKDDRVDALEQATGNYLMRLTREEPDEEPARRAIALLYVVNELEHIGDVISKNLMSYAKKKVDENLSFSAEGLQEIGEFHADVVETLRMASSALSTWDYRLARDTALRKEFGNRRLAELHSRHLDRLRQGLKESIDTSTIHLDFIADLERMNFHAAAIGAALAEALKDRAAALRPGRR